MLRPTVPPELRHGPFTTAQAAAHGVTRTMLLSSAWRPVIRGVYVHRDVPDSRRLRAQAVGLVFDSRLFLCGISAAWLYGVDVHPYREPVPSLWVGTHNGARPRTRAGWRVCELTVSPEDLTTVEGIAVTTPPRTAFDCARLCAQETAVVVLDALAHRGLLDLDALGRYADSQFRIRNKRRVARLVELADARSESPPESRLRLLLVLEGLQPVPQYEIYDGDTFVARVDLAFPEQRLAVEYEGRQHAETAALDERRRAALRDVGWELIRVYAEDLAGAGPRRALVFRVRSVLAAR